MAISLIEIVSQGGCYWRSDQPDSPGHAIAVPNGTAFKIAWEGPQSNIFISGTCRDGWYVVEDGDYSGNKFRSPNEAVNKVREPNSNAFLHMHFLIDGSWVLADEYRKMDKSKLDEAEMFALERERQSMKNNKKYRALDEPSLLRATAKFLVKNQKLMEVYRTMPDRNEISIDEDQENRTDRPHA
jgi:hypothetical protein